MALRLQSNLLYGVSRVYSQQCGYTLVDVQAMHDKMRQMLKSIPAGGLDPAAGKAKPDQLVLPYDPSFLPENNLPGLGIDLSKLNRLLEIDASQQSSVFLPQTPDLSQSALSSNSSLRLNIPSDDNILRDMGGFGSETDMASSAHGGADFGRLLASSLNEEGGVLLQPDFEFDEDGNIIELGVRNQNETLLLADENIELAITSEPARPTRQNVIYDAQNNAATEPADTEPTMATAPQRQRAPKILPTDDQTALRNAELALMNDGYMHNMAVASRQKRNNKVPTQAKKHAALWVFGLGIGSVGAGVGTSRMVHPLHIFSGDELYETLVAAQAGRKHGLDDDPETQERRVRARDENDEHMGRIDLLDDNFWNQDVELGRHASPPLHDDNSSQMPWNITASVQSSRHDASAANIFRGFGSVSDFSSRGIPEAAGSFGRDPALGLLGRSRSRLTSASPLAGRGFPYDLDNLSNPGHADDDLGDLNLDLSHYLDGEDIAMGDSNPLSLPYATAGPAYTSQQALQNSLTESAMDQEGINFLDFLAAKIQSLKPTGATTSEAVDGDLSASTDNEVKFSTLLPTRNTSPAVATQGLMHILALATKGLLRVRQDKYEDQSTQEYGVKYEYGDIFVKLAEPGVLVNLVTIDLFTPLVVDMGRTVDQEVHAAFVEFRAKEDDKCLSVQCIYCQQIRAKNTSRQKQHLLECPGLRGAQAQAQTQPAPQPTPNGIGAANGYPPNPNPAGPTAPVPGPAHAGLSTPGNAMMSNGVNPHATPMQTPLQNLSGRPSLPAGGPVPGPSSGPPPQAPRTTPKAKPKTSTSSLPAPPLDDVHAAFVEFRAKEEDKCLSVQCIYCQQVRAKNTSRQRQHLLECPTYLSVMKDSIPANNLLHTFPEGEVARSLQIPAPSLELDFRLSLKVNPKVGVGPGIWGTRDWVTFVGGQWAGRWGKGVVVVMTKDSTSLRANFLLQTADDPPAFIVVKTSGWLTGAKDVLDKLNDPQSADGINPNSYKYRVNLTMETGDDRYTFLNTLMWVASGCRRGQENSTRHEEQHQHHHDTEPANNRTEALPETASLSSSDSDSSSVDSDRPPRVRQGSTASTLHPRSSSRPAEITRIYSGVHLDDHSVYHNDDDHEHSDENDEKDIEPELEVRNGIVTERDRDLETGRQGAGAEMEKSKSSRSEQDPKLARFSFTCLVTWNGPDDPENPKNWPMKMKWTTVVMVSCFTFISPVSSSMVAPALSTLAKDLNITDAVESQLALSIFVLAYAFGPLILGPLSEIYGRVIVLQLANLLYLVFNIACGVSQTKTQMIVCRFFSGLGGSAPLAVGGGVLSDCFRPEERGKSVAVYSLAPLLGPAVGPIAGGFIAENTTWRWVFYATTIADGVIQLAGLFLLKETYAPRILMNRAKKLRKETNDESYQTEVERQNKKLSETLSSALVRPFRLLLTQPIVQAIAGYLAYCYGIMYLVLSTFPSLWTGEDYYNESIGIGGLNYISLGIGFWLGSQICAPLNDPPNIGAALFGMGTIVTFQCAQTYLIDSYTRFAASAMAASAFLRSICGFAFPLFAPYMYDALHYGWGNSLLGFIALGLGIPAPIFLWKFGALLRKKTMLPLLLLPLATLASASPSSALTLQWKNCSTSNFPSISDVVSSNVGSSASSYIPLIASAPNLDCAELQVPVDWSQPHGETITLGMARYRATKPGKRQGSIIYNPGGPGVSGSISAMAQALGLSFYTNGTVDNYDVIGLDPRGIGMSSRVKCDPELWNKRVQLSLFPETEDEFEDLVSANRAFGESCREKTGKLFYHLDTTSAARDIEAVRLALGEEELNWIGLSYGTQLGGAYAELFPQHVGRMVLDGMLDHSQSETDALRTEVSTYEDTLGQFFKWCNETATVDECPMKGENLPAIFDELVAAADENPIEAASCKSNSSGCRPIMTGEDIRTNVQPLLPFVNDNPAVLRVGWPTLAGYLNATIAGDASGLSSSLATSETAASFPGLAIGCADWLHSSTTVADLKYKAQMARYLAPHTQGATQSYLYQSACIGWPVPVTMKKAPPMLLVNALHDPETSYVWANGMREQIPSGVLLTRDGSGHTSYSLRGEASKIIDRFLANGTLPRENMVVDS
ncbi:uncharacterized protein BDV14DRAFT_193269 [Aspergillus stella-maris]|uniref:uncharacterized protein n=1 Tax=Aspergillus stella-maris TaxID=1810926 RepID=UPI003CCE0222